MWVMPDTIAENMQSRQAPRFLPCGDTALCVEFGDSIDRHVSALVLALAHRLENASLPGIVELVPTFRSLLIHYDPSVLRQAELKANLAPFLTGLEAAEGSGRLWRLPACYDESLAPDLAEVANRTRLTQHEVAERHSAVTYHVYMVGFLPGYPYMGDLPPEIALPRRENPRTKVPPGSIAIATTMTAVYPQESPGGWHLIGRTPLPLWDLRRDPPAILGAGDKVVFQPVSLAEYETLSAKSAAGEFRLEPEKRPA
jgi:KipI family sensor histidine kinase inhibitor